MPVPAIWNGLRPPATPGRRGETILYVLLGVDEANADNPIVMRAAVEALRGAGQIDVARALAVETALAMGL